MMGRIRPLAMLAVLLLAACSASPGRDGPEREVFTVATEFSQGGPATTVDVIDVGLPLLHNLSGQSVRLRWVRFASPPRPLRVKGIYAYLVGKARDEASPDGLLRLRSGRLRRLRGPGGVGQASAGARDGRHV